MYNVYDRSVKELICTEKLQSIFCTVENFYYTRGRILIACGDCTLVATVHLWRLITSLFVNKHLNRERFGDFGKIIIMVARFFYCKPNFRN